MRIAGFRAQAALRLRGVGAKPIKYNSLMYTYAFCCLSTVCVYRVEVADPKVLCLLSCPPN